MDVVKPPTFKTNRCGRVKIDLPSHNEPTGVVKGTKRKLAHAVSTALAQVIALKNEHTFLEKSVMLCFALKFPRARAASLSSSKSERLGQWPRGSSSQATPR